MTDKDRAALRQALLEAINQMVKKEPSEHGTICYECDKCDVDVHNDCLSTVRKAIDEVFTSKE